MGENPSTERATYIIVIPPASGTYFFPAPLVNNLWKKEQTTDKEMTDDR